VDAENLIQNNKFKELIKENKSLYENSFKGKLFNEISKNRTLTIEESAPNVTSINKIQDKIIDKTDRSQNSISLNKVSDIWSKSNNNEENKSKVKVDMSNIESKDN
jgi:hypothetical protein